jgi:predicted transcriptional regulator
MWTRSIKKIKVSFGLELFMKEWKNPMKDKVRDFMRPGVLTCRKETKIGQVAVMLDQHKVHSLMVTDRDGRIIGVITDFDLISRGMVIGRPARAWK